MSYFSTQPIKRKAAKDYKCDACAALLDYGVDAFELTDDELKAVESAISNGKQINKGETYVYSTYVYDGVWSTYRAIPKMHDICNRLKILQGE